MGWRRAGGRRMSQAAPLRGGTGGGWGGVALLLGLLCERVDHGRIPHASSTLSADDSTSCAPQRVRVSEGVRE